MGSMRTQFHNKIMLPHRVPHPDDPKEVDFLQCNTGNHFVNIKN